MRDITVLDARLQYTAPIIRYYPFLHCEGGASVPYYNFEVVKGDQTIAAERAVVLRHIRAAWPKVATLARKAATGSRVRVTDEAGDVVILVGVASALRYFDH